MENNPLAARRRNNIRIGNMFNTAKTRRQIRWRWVGCCIALLTTNPALANSLEDMVGVGGRSKAMGGVGTALSTDLSAVYYNVANLAFGSESTFSLGFSHIDYDFFVDGSPGDPEQESMRARDNITLGFSLLLPFELSLGVMVNLAPKVPQFFDQGSPDSIPRFVMYGQRLEQISFMLGVAYKIAENLSLGIGTAALVNSNLDIDNSIPIWTKGLPPQNRFSWTLEPNMAYYFGLHYRPAEDFHLGVSYRTSLFHKMDAYAVTSVHAGGIPLDLNMLFEVYSWFSPAQVALGATYLPNDSSLISFDLTWYDWSRYPGPFLKVSPAEDPALATILEFEEYKSPNFKDIVVPRLGLEVKPIDEVALRAGYSYRFSPAPLPSNEQNILDSNMHIGTLGLGYRLEYSDKSTQLALDFDLYASVGIMPTTKVTKSGAQEVLNDFEFGGMVYDFGILLTSGF